LQEDLMDDQGTRAGQLLAAARAGSPEALGEVLQSCREYLLHIADRELDPNLRAKGGASDLVQQTFLEAQRDFLGFQGNSEEDLLRWLRRLLLHNVADFTRHYQGTNKRQANREVSLQEETPSGTQGFQVAAETPSPSRQVLAQEQAQALEQALARLPEDYRRVLALRHQDQLPFEEIGAQLQRTPEAARKLWARAVERLRQELDAPP
jgi:RNA polymerase sigma-70 factor (ECF subfamily)